MEKTTNVVNKDKEPSLRQEFKTYSKVLLRKWQELPTGSISDVFVNSYRVSKGLLNYTTDLFLTMGGALAPIRSEEYFASVRKTKLGVVAHLGGAAIASGAIVSIGYLVSNTVFRN
ncbi:MAG: hypothetical protein ACHQX1_01040 [Candidatus Micrarchaeales archaeon]